MVQKLAQQRCDVLAEVLKQCLDDERLLLESCISSDVMTFSYYRKFKKKSKYVSEGLMHVAAWYRETPGSKSSNLGDNCQFARPVTLPNFVVLLQEACEIYTVKSLWSQKSGPKFTKVP